LTDNTSDPKRVAGSRITLTTIEDGPDIQDIEDVAEVDLLNTAQTFILQSEYQWTNETNTFSETQTFLESDGKPYDLSIGTNRSYLDAFRQYLPVFYLGSLRTSRDEFSRSSSQFWYQLIESVNIPIERESEILHELKRVNERIVKADPRMGKIADILNNTTKIAFQNQGSGNAGLRTLPSDISEIFSHAQVILQQNPNAPWLSILDHGEGAQSLLILFLLQAFIECLMFEQNKIRREPILMIEEPETHLHPHAVRSLWYHLQNLPGQKIITTHSPYFVQHCPIRTLRLVRLSEYGTEVNSVPDRFSAKVPESSHLLTLSKEFPDINVQQSPPVLTVKGILDEKTLQKIVSGYSDPVIQDQAEKVLNDLKKRSDIYVADDMLRSLETFAQRIRGEIFFAVRWLIVEGQTDYVIVHALAHAMGYNLDSYGISVIDAQNNGKPIFFGILAHALNIPWQAVFDGDDAGREYLQQLNQIGLNDSEVGQRCHTHEVGDLESQLIADGFASDLRVVLAELGIPNAENLPESDILSNLRKRKLSYGTVFAEHLRHKSDLTSNMLRAFQIAINNLCKPHESQI
ncbi:MAG: DUF2813 domain-containing protein, partial [Bacteroidetes bacterium]|nr:DUF2813 domain-containing protein [Bacteroidota bacterium]